MHGVISCETRLYGSYYSLLGKENSEGASGKCRWEKFFIATKISLFTNNINNQKNSLTFSCSVKLILILFNEQFSMNIQRIFFAFMLVGLFSLMVGCSTTINRQMEQSSIEQFDSLRQVYYHLNDSLSQSFQIMLQDDSKKIEHMQRLLAEIKDSGHFDADTLQTLSASLDELQLMRYDSISLADAKVVDRYDSMDLATSQAIMEYTEQHPDFENNPVMTVLVDQIMDANNSVMLYRLQYDRLIQQFNHFLEEYKSVIATLDSTGAPVQKRPMFKLVNEK